MTTTASTEFGRLKQLSDNIALDLWRERQRAAQLKSIQADYRRELARKSAECVRKYGERLDKAALARAQVRIDRAETAD